MVEFKNKKMNKKLSEKERRELQLQMLDEIHEICQNNGIRYSLAYGTLLGAIRHKGFIPWDDDVDIMMPYHDMLKFKNCLQSDNIEFLDVDDCKYYEWFFPRIASKKTFSKPGRFVKEYGVNIDLYPVVNIKDGDEEVEKYLKEGRKLCIRTDEYIKWRKRAEKYLSLKTLPFYHTNVLKLRNYLIKDADVKTSTLFSLGGAFKKHNVFTKDLFNSFISTNFEDRTYNIVSCHDSYLTQIYGDYMQFPPEDKRVPYHGGIYYWK